jgi:hypothetical protein
VSALRTSGLCGLRAVAQRLPERVVQEDADLLMV